MPITDLEKYRVIDNVNSYYRLTSESKRELLLNKYPNAAAAYSLRLLDGYYRGPLVRIRRDDDTGVEVDVYPDYNNELSLDSLVSNVAVHTTNDGIEDTDYDFQLSLNSLGEFVGATGYSSTVEASDATVCIWYDQANGDNGNHAIQDTLTNQPLIVSGGVIIEENGKPAIDFDGTNDVLPIGNVSLYSNTNGQSIFAVFNRGTSGSGVITKYYTGDQREYRLIFSGTSITYGVQSNPSLYDANQEASTPILNNSQNLATAVWNPSVSTSVALNGSAFSNASSPAVSATNTARSVNMGEYNDSVYVDGNLQEIIVYTSDQTTNRLDIEEDINNHYQIEGFEAPQPLLDEFSGAAAAYSLRKLSSTYTGPLVRIRRDIDDIEVDVYPDDNGEFSLLSPIADGGNELSSPALGNYSIGSTDKTKLYEFVYGQSCDLTVVVWYDQAGSNDATQTTTGSQPKIYDSTTGVVTENGKPAVYFDGTDDHLQNSSVPTGTIFTANAENTIVGVMYQDGANISNVLISNNSTTDIFTVYATQGIYNNLIYDVGNTGNNELVYSYGGATTFEDVQHLLFLSSSSTLQQICLDGTQLTSGTAPDTIALSSTILRIGSRFSNNLMGSIQELIIYPSDEASNRAGIESNINTYYSIYS